LLKAGPVDAGCIGSNLMAESGSAEIKADLKDTSPHAPMVWSKRATACPNTMRMPLSRSSTSQRFLQSGRGLIEELREVRFPVFVERD